MTRPPAPARPEAPRAAAPLPVRAARTRPGPAIPETSLILGPVDTAPGTARATLTTALALWELRHLTDDAQAITSELVTNAVAASTHGAQARGLQPPPVMLWITARDGELCIRVWDPDPTPPPRDPPPPDDDAENGRGLLIVAALATRWGWHPARNGGKYTWATLQLDAQPGDEQQRDRP
jgi:anti-sigma regulatory factor (Ser/Thr protein kinase)